MAQGWGLVALCKSHFDITKLCTLYIHNIFIAPKTRILWGIAVSKRAYCERSGFRAPLVPSISNPINSDLAMAISVRGLVRGTPTLSSYIAEAILGFSLIWDLA